MEAKFEQRIRILERRQTDDFKDQLQTISYAVNQKLEGLRTTIDNFPGIMKPIVDKEQKTHLEKKSREKRSLPAQPTTIVERVSYILWQAGSISPTSQHFYGQWFFFAGWNTRWCWW